MTAWQIDPATPVDELWARWVVAIRNEVAEGTLSLFELYGTAHVAPFFKCLGAITEANCAGYSRQRLGKVKRATLQKELCTLRRFLEWCQEQGYVDEAPPIAGPRKRVMGTPFAMRRRGRATELSMEEARAIVDALPAWSERVPCFAVRPRFIVAYETALRPSTLDQLSVPQHYRKGATTLTITDEIDKARFGRELPLSEAARAALDEIAPEHGLIFGKHDYRDQLKKAAERVLPKHKAATFTAYDFRHARLTQLAETGNLPGAGFVAGHKRASTTAIYIQPNRRAAERTLTAAGPTGFAPSRNPATKQTRLVGQRNDREEQRLCEGGDLNPYGNSPASTSRYLQTNEVAGITEEWCASRGQEMPRLATFVGAATTIVVREPSASTKRKVDFA